MKVLFQVSDLHAATNGKNKLPDDISDLVGQLFRKQCDSIDVDVISRVSKIDFRSRCFGKESIRKIKPSCLRVLFFSRKTGSGESCCILVS